MKEINQECKLDNLALFALDSTTITLTSKPLWNQGIIHPVKLFSGINLMNSELPGAFSSEKIMIANMAMKLLSQFRQIL